MSLAGDAVDLFVKLLKRHRNHLHELIAQEDALSRPCPDGRWRLAGKDPVPGMAEKAEQHRAELSLTEEMLRTMETTERAG